MTGCGDIDLTAAHVELLLPEGLAADVADARRMLAQFESGRGSFDIAPTTVRGLLDGIRKLQTEGMRRVVHERQAGAVPADE